MSTMSNKEYTSELGKLYQSKRDEAPLRKIVFEVYSLFKFWIESGEMLPINVSAKDYRFTTPEQITWVIDNLKKKGCVVEYEIKESIVGMDRKFILVDLV
mgnify:FL=1